MIRPGNLHCNLENSGIFRYMPIVHSLGDANINTQILTNMIRQLQAVSGSYLRKDPDPGELQFFKPREEGAPLHTQI